jgi:hypothetical protein
MSENNKIQTGNINSFSASGPIGVIEMNPGPIKWKRKVWSNGYILSVGRIVIRGSLPFRTIEITEIPLFLQISAKEKAAYICFLKNKREKPPQKLQIYRLENPCAI